MRKRSRYHLERSIRARQRWIASFIEYHALYPKVFTSTRLVPRWRTELAALEQALEALATPD